MVDFSKAFDTVNHVVLIRKLCLLGCLLTYLIGLFPFSQDELSRPYCKVNVVYSAARGN